MAIFNRLSNLCSTGQFMPHGYCYLWKPGLVLLHAVSDAGITLAYTLIPCTLLFFIRKREDLPFNWMFICFGLFIIACGITHFMEILTIWTPLYWLAGVIKAFTAIVSLVTAIFLIRLIPQALVLPSPEMLRRANQALQKEMQERQQLEKLARQRQLELEQAARITSMGELTMTLAHEINQPLAAISNYMSGCVRRLKTGQYQIEDIIRAMQLAAEQSERAGDIIHRLKNFMHKGTLYYEVFDMNILLKNSINLLEDEISNQQIALSYEFSNDLPPIKLDRLQMKQVVINLVRNSLEAMQDAKVENKILTLRTAVLDNKYIQVDVIDNGPGFDSDIQASFKPYHTTKPYGTGLGLAICRTIIEAHSGRLQIKTPKLGGAWLQFILPINQVIDDE